MAPVKVKFVVSFSSQDEVHKASNLTCNDGFKKWLSHSKDRSGKVEAILQLDHPCKFSFIDIGTVWCSNLELRVGCSDWPQSKEFVPLVPIVSLMTPIDCRLGRNINNTKMFGKSDFSESVVGKSWDRLQIICRQPFRKDVQFGITFVRISSANSMQDISKTKEELCQQKPTPILKSAELNLSAIKKHFFGDKKSESDDSADMLKNKLLKMAGSTDNGSDQEQALSRTAKLVMKASENAGPYSPAHRMKQPNRKLFSEHTAKKDGPAIDEEIKKFLPTLNVSKTDIDIITVADLRHKFERKKQRKLTLEEKRTFSEICQDFICDLFDHCEEALETSKSSNKSYLSAQPICMSPKCEKTPSHSSAMQSTDTDKSLKQIKQIGNSSSTVSRLPTSGKHSKDNYQVSKPSKADISVEPKSNAFRVFQIQTSKNSLKKSGEKITKAAKTDSDTNSDCNSDSSLSYEGDDTDSNVRFDKEDDDWARTGSIAKQQGRKTKTSEDVKKSYADLYENLSPVATDALSFPNNSNRSVKKRQRPVETCESGNTAKMEKKNVLCVDENGFTCTKSCLSLNDRDYNTSTMGSKTGKSLLPTSRKQRLSTGSSPNQMKNGRIYRMCSPSPAGKKSVSSRFSSGSENIFSHLMSFPAQQVPVSPKQVDGQCTMLTLKSKDSDLQSGGFDRGITITASTSSPGGSLVQHENGFRSRGRGQHKKRSTAVQGSGRGRAKTWTESPPPQVMCDKCENFIALSEFVSHGMTCASPSRAEPNFNLMLTSFSEDLSDNYITHDELVIDTVDYKECPICCQRFPQDVLIVHASECGLL